MSKKNIVWNRLAGKEVEGSPRPVMTKLHSLSVKTISKIYGLTLVNKESTNTLPFSKLILDKISTLKNK
jgi:hypothetical protein